MKPKSVGLLSESCDDALIDDGVDDSNGVSMYLFFRAMNQASKQASRIRSGQQASKQQMEIKVFPIEYFPNADFL